MVIDGISKDPMAFAKIITYPSNKTYFTGVNGNFKIDNQDSLTKFVVSHPYFNKKTIKIIDQKDFNELEISLIRKNIFLPEDKTDSMARKVIDRAIEMKKSNSPYNKKGIQYSTYNKLVSTPQNYEKLTPFLELYLKKFVPRILDFKKEHHLLIMESATKNRFQ